MTALLLQFYWVLTLISPSSDGHELHIRVEGDLSSKGHFFVALYRSSDDFPSQTKVFKRAVESCQNRIVVLNNLPTDTYAVAVFQDQNDNQVLDKNFFGVPTEKYGFSNQAREIFSAPSFKSASFNLSSDRVIRIRLE